MQTLEVAGDANADTNVRPQIRRERDDRARTEDNLDQLQSFAGDCRLFSLGDPRSWRPLLCVPVPKRSSVQTDSSVRIRFLLSEVQHPNIDQLQFRSEMIMSHVVTVMRAYPGGQRNGDDQCVLVAADRRQTMRCC